MKSARIHKASKALQNLNPLDNLFPENNLATLIYNRAWSRENSTLLTKLRQIGS